MKDEIDDIRESLDRLEAESQRRKNKLLEQVFTIIIIIMPFVLVMTTEVEMGFRSFKVKIFTF